MTTDIQGFDRRPSTPRWIQPVNRNPERLTMKAVVIGGTGLIGSKVVAKLTELGHEAIPASPQTGVDTLTGTGLAEAVTGAQVVADDESGMELTNHTALITGATAGIGLKSARLLAQGGALDVVPRSRCGSP
jgi:hypothetical protein